MGDIATGMLDVFTEDAVKELLDLRPWMQDKTFLLLTKPTEVEEYIDRLIEKGICGLDLETTSLNTRRKKNGGVYAKIVGVCLAISPNEGVYIPVSHEDKEYNVPYKFMVQQLKRLTANCICVYHNFKYDGEVLRNHGIIIEDEDLYEDTYLMAAIQDASRKDKGLKWLSEHILKRPMIEISELGVTGSKKKVVAFDMVPPQTAVYYGASDAMNTLGLYLVFKKSIDQQDPDGKQGPWYIYKIEKRCLFVTMEMERNHVLIDREYLLKIKEDVQSRMKNILKDVHAIAGREFDINSPKQLGTLLFDELKIRYPLKEKSASGQYKTDEKTLVLIEQEAPIVKKILSYRGYTKLLGTYIENFLNNVDEDNYAKFQLNQVRADTGRFSASGGRGIKVDGCCGVNCQNIPTYNKNDPDSIDMRRAVIARPGYKIFTIDYSGEELRIAANMSREPKWIQEFNHGSADLHTITGKIIHGKEEINKQERGLGKCVAKGTRIATQRGWIPVEELTLKDKVITHTGKLKKIEAIHDMGVKKAVTIISSSGHKIKCGYNHRFLTPAGEWVRAEDLKLGQEILSSSCKLINPKVSPDIHFNFWAKGKDNNISDSLPYIKPNYQWGKLLGYLLGDGHIHRYHAGIICSEKYSDVKEDIIRTAEGLGLPCSAKLRKRKDKPESYQALWEINVGSTVFSRFCERIGFSGRHKKIFKVPDWILRSTKDVSRGFLQALFETDGTVDKSGTVSICTKDIDLARDVVLLLAQFDVKSYIYEKLSKRYDRVYYQVQFGRAGAEEFYKNIGFISNIKKAKLQALIDKPKAAKTLKGQEWVTKVKGKEFHDSVELMDLTIKGDHTYVAEGLVTHNTLNFHTIYGGGAGGFAVRAKLSVDIAKKMLFNFFKKYDVLAKWLVDEAKRAKKRGYSKTAFGRRRPLTEFYRSSDRQIMARGDRCAINSCIQGGGADIIKIALYRVWKWIHSNGFGDDQIRILMPVHDEIVYEVKEDMLGYFIENISEIMKLREFTERLKWPVGLEVDAEYGDSFSITNDYFKEKAQLEKEANAEGSALPDIKNEFNSTEHSSEEEPGAEIEPEIEKPEEKEVPEEKEEEPDIKRKDTQTEQEGHSNQSHEIQKHSFISESNGTDPYINFTVTFSETKNDKVVQSKDKDVEVDEKALADDRLKNYLDDLGFYVYEIKSIVPMVSNHLKNIIDMLNEYDSQLIGPKCRIKLVAPDGSVLHKVYNKVSVDAFQSLCLWYNI